MAELGIEAVKCTTDVEILRITYTWVIKNFSFISTARDNKIKSPIFTVGENKEFMWRLRLYPNGNVEGSEAFVAFYLQLVSPASREVLAKFRFFIIMADGRKRQMGPHQMRFFTQYKSIGDHEFIDRGTLLEETNGFVKNDILTIVCELTVGTGKTYETTEELHSCAVTTNNDGGLAKHLEALLDNKIFADVTLIAKDGGTLLVHKAMLVARSPVFAAMFRHNTRERKRKVVQIADITGDVLRQMVIFIYTGKAENLDNLAHATDMLAVADKYALEDLKVMCEQAIKKCLSAENAIRVLEIADRHNSRSLTARIKNFMHAHAQQFVGQFIGYVTEHNASPARIWYDFSFSNPY